MRYFMALFAALVLLFLLVFLLFHGGGKSKTPTGGRTLYSYAATNAVVRLTIDGPVNSNQIHSQNRITVGRDDVTFERIQGYDGAVTNKQTYANSGNAYDTFLLSLARAGFTKGDNDPSLRDERGFCPLGDRYIFELIQDDKDLERYWSSSCGNPKTYQGSLSLTLSLFQAQVPNYGSLAQATGSGF